MTRVRERWAPVPQDTRYQVSDRGRVRGARGRILKPTPTDRGYLKVCLGAGRGPGSQPYVHALVCAAFVGPQPGPSWTVDHVDWDRTNNAASNLRWLTLVDNSIRWQARTADGRNVWSTPDDAPEDAAELEPLTQDELDRIAAAWTATQ